MADFANEKEVFQFWDEFSRAALPTRRQLALTTGIAQCYVEGIQWIDDYWHGFVGRKTASAGRKLRDYDPSSTELRVVNNQTHKLVQKVAAHTHPEELYLDAVPAPSAYGPMAAVETKIHENLANAAVDDCGFTRRAQVANWRRCVGGTWGIGLAIQQGERQVGNQIMPDKRLRAFQFNPTQLVLDPASQEMDLWDHETVGYTDIWSADAIERTFGIKLDHEKLRTFETLEPLNQEISKLSDFRIFSKFARYSRTKGARLSQFHCRDSSGRFGKWYVILDLHDEERQLINADDLTTPFGGMGMPFGLLHAHWRTDSIWSSGDAAQMRDDQDKINLAESLFWRIVQKHAGFQWIVDQRFFGSRPTKDEISRELTNQVGGIILGSTRSRNDGVQMPQLVTPPSPQAWLQETIASYGLSSREKGHTSEGMYGSLKTHTPDSSFQRALNEAGQVIGVRVKKDLKTYEYMLSVVHGTTIKHVQEKNPGTLAYLTQRGFEGQDFAAILRADPYNTPVLFSIREGSVRARSHEAKKADLDFALQNQGITADEYRWALADSLDSALTEDDRQMRSEAKRQAMAIVSGAEWVPGPVGKWATLFIGEFVRARFDPRAKADPGAQERLVRATQLVYAYHWQEQALAAGPQEAGAQPAQAQAETEQGPKPGDSVSVEDLISSLSQNGSGAGAPVPASAA